MEYIVRLIVGGLVVSSFAIVGDVLRPKSFAGLFGAAPSVALATLSLTFWTKGGPYVALEGRSMILGAIALAAYSFIVCQLMMRFRWSALAATTAAVSGWLVIAVGLEHILLSWEMIVRAKFSALKEGSWREYLTRFALGGLATVLAGGVAELFGPSAGGLFLAFPAIFCASATLIEKHERKRKQEKGLKGSERGKNAAALDAAGAGLGSVALALFGLVIWLLAEKSAPGSLILASAAWLAAAIVLWHMRKKSRILW
jgi:hypothetical protein